YQWYRDSVPIATATSPTHTVLLDEVGSRLAVKVTGSKYPYQSVSRMSAETAEVPHLALTSTPKPTITGTASIGSELTAVAGDWQPAPVTVSYQWLRADQAITGATSRTYTVAPSDAGSALKVAVTGSKTGYTPKTMTSDPTGIVAAETFTSTVPTVVGNTTATATLMIVRGNWDPAPTGWSYQWFRGDTAITGATAMSYQLTSADVGSSLKVAVTGTRDGYSPSTRLSASTPVVTSAPRMLLAWGLDDWGQAEPPVNLSNVAAISAGDDFGLALKSDGTVVGWGNEEHTEDLDGLSGIGAISAGGTLRLFLKPDGTVLGWNSALGDVAAISAGMEHELALLANGTVLARGSNDEGQASVPSGLSGVIAISAGQTHNLALKADGTVVAWGNNNHGQAKVPSGLSHVIAIDAGRDHSLALKSDGTVVAWGSNAYGQSAVPKGLNGVVAISAGHRHSLAVKSDGTLVAWGSDTYYQSSVPKGLGQVRAVSAGPYYNLVLGSFVTRLTSTPTPKVSDKTPQVDQVLTAVAGTWRPAPVTLSYQWYRGSTPIAGETSSTYKVRVSDVGAKLKVKVTGSKDGYFTASKTSAATSKVKKATLSPTPTPTIDTPTPTVEQAVSAAPGTWGPPPVSLAYQWYRVNASGKTSKISGATTASYAVRGTDAGYRLKVTVTGSKPGYTTKSKTSSLTKKVAKAVFAVAGTPSISVDGTPRVGKAVSATPGAFTPAATGYSYQWYRGTSVISKATKASYLLGAADLGRLVTVRMTSTRSGYVSVVQKAPPIGPVQAGLPALAVPLLSDPTPVVAQVLAITNTVCPAAATNSPGYQWSSGSRPVSGATSATYTVRAADRGARLKVTVTCSAPDYAAVAKSSAATAAVAKA
ncbi:MAG TPA: hypothetical protein VGK53_16715, partial [Propionicimonas sp.]